MATCHPFIIHHISVINQSSHLKTCPISYSSSYSIHTTYHTWIQHVCACLPVCRSCILNICICINLLFSLVDHLMKCHVPRTTIYFITTDDVTSCTSVCQKRARIIRPWLGYTQTASREKETNLKLGPWHPLFLFFLPSFTTNMRFVSTALLGSVRAASKANMQANVHSITRCVPFSSWLLF